MQNLRILILSFSIALASAPVQAKAASDRIAFRGTVIDGPLMDTVITGHCKRKARGDAHLQRTRCAVTLGSGYKIVDPEASVQIVGGGRALRIILGPDMDTGDRKGNYKISSFEATTFYDREISLFDIPRYFSAVEVNFSGVSVAGGSSTTNPDCLIWDIVGDGVF